VIRLDNVTKFFSGQKVPAVKNLNMEIHKGNVCVLVGPSGCGKTTTLKMINRLYEPTGGTIYINGQDISKLDPIALRLGIGYVIQEIGLFPHLTVEDNVATVPREKKWPKDKVCRNTEEMLRLVGLEPEVFKKRYPSALSGGQRQRVGVARALAADPPILLMDEPFGAVDPITRARLQNEFLRIQEQMQKTIVFVTHDIDEAIKMADNIAVMREGTLVQYASPGELLSQPADEFVAKLVGNDRSIKRLHLIRCREILKKPADFLCWDTPLEEVREKIENSKIRVVLVVDRDNIPKGLIEARDLKQRTGQVAGDICREIPDFVTSDATLRDAFSMMLEYGQSYVVVTDKNNGCQGYITVGDLLEVMKGNDVS
jgi:osmoprotectant transport system ATP-binding protein